MLQLNETLLIGSGKNRSCYQHPEDPNLCVKVLHDHSHPKTQRRETRYFNHLHKVGVSWDYVVPLIEMLPTSLGEGAVFELIRDQNGEISKTVHHYLLQNDSEMDKLIVEALRAMKHHLLQQNIVFRDLNPLNLLLQNQDDHHYQLKVIDGIGHNEWIPLCNTTFFGQRKIKRMWNRKLDYWFGRYEHLAHLITPYEE